MWKTDGRTGRTATEKKSKEKEKNAIDFSEASEQEKSR